MNIASSVVNISTDPLKRTYVHPLLNKNPVSAVKSIHRNAGFIELNHQERLENPTIKLPLDSFPSTFTDSHLKGNGLGRIVDIYA